MKLTISFITLFLFSMISSFAQGDKILMTIGDQSITVQEFERIYNKNNLTGVLEKQPVNEYLDLFINFKLKVLEAEKLGMDKNPGFISELNGYRDQLAKPYLNDSVTQEELMKLVYERLKSELHVGHILIRLDPNASPADTLTAYTKLMGLRKRILAGENFQELAKANSQDPSVSKNGGDIGWMTANRTVWDFENVIYSTPVKQVSLPQRTQFGYHIATVWEKRPSRGTVHVAHIFVRAPEDMSPELKLQAEKKINDVYDSLKVGISFSQLAKNNSDDRSTATKGGELPWFGSGQMIPEFEAIAFALKKQGEYSKPVHSFYGWHILQLIEAKGLGTYEEMRPELLAKVSDSQMTPVKKKLYLDKLKKEYSYSSNPQNLKKIYALIDSTIFTGKWNDSLLRGNKDVLFTFADKTLTTSDFASYLKDNQKKTSKGNPEVLINGQFDNFVDYSLREYEKGTLAVIHPEFKYILQEYHDGILLFDLTDKMVWSKAVQDTAGLEKYYEANKTQYVWGKRADVLIFSSDSAQMLAAAKTLVNKYGTSKKFSTEFLLSKLCSADSLRKRIDIKEARFEKGDNAEVDKTDWKTGTGENYTNDGKASFVFVRGVLEPDIKKLNEARGLITADYQNFLEKAWIEELKAKYPVKVDVELLKTIK
jgi:peptidyl-prolyl cis-trans isomerase SurA